MTEATTRTLTQMEKLIRKQRRDPRKVFMKIFLAEEPYKMNRSRLIAEAKKAGALYRIGKVSLIKVERLDEYLKSKGTRIAADERSFRDAAASRKSVQWTVFGHVLAR